MGLGLGLGLGFGFGFGFGLGLERQQRAAAWRCGGAATLGVAADGPRVVAVGG